MEVCSVPSTMPPPELWWSPLEFAPKSMSENNASSSDKDEELNFRPDSESDDHAFGNNAGSASDTESDEWDVDYQAARANTQSTSRLEAEQHKNQETPYDKIQSFMLTLKNRLEGEPTTKADETEIEITHNIENLCVREGELAEASRSESSEPETSHTPNSQHAREETICNAEQQLKELLSTFEGLRERMVTLLHDDDDEEEKVIESNAKELFSDGSDSISEGKDDSSIEMPVLDLSKPLPSMRSKDEILGTSTPWSESSEPLNGRSNTISSGVTDSTSHSFTAVEEDDLPSTDPWRGGESEAPEQSLGDMELLSILDHIRTHPTTSSEASEFSTACLSQQIDGAKLTDYDDQDSLFGDEEFEDEPEPYEPDSAPIIKNLTRLTSGGESRFSQFFDSPHTLTPTQSSAGPWQPTSYHAPIRQHPRRQSVESDSRRTSGHEDVYRPTFQPLDRYRVSSDLSYGAERVSRMTTLSQNGLLSPRVAESSPLTRAASSSENHVRLRYAPAAAVSKWTPAATLAGANTVTSTSAAQPGAGAGLYLNTSGPGLYSAPAGSQRSPSMGSTPYRQLSSSPPATSHGSLLRSNLYASAPGMSSLSAIQPPSPGATSALAGSRFSGGAPGVAHTSHGVSRSPLQQPQSFPPSVYAQMQRERLVAAARQQVLESDGSPPPALSLYSSTPSDKDWPRAQTHAAPSAGTTHLHTPRKAPIEDVM